VPTEAGTELLIGRCSTAGLHLFDESVSRRHARVVSTDDGRILLEDLGSTNGTLLNGQPIQSSELTDGDKIQVGMSTVLRFCLNDLLDESYAEHLYTRAIRDDLTGLHDRRYFEECLERDLALARRHGLTMAVAILDVDHFRSVNTRFGHPGGDRVLRSVAARLQSLQRSESMVARFGGEEFAVLLRGVDAAGAGVFAERMRHAMATEPFPLGKESINLTVSIGLAVTSTDGTTEARALIDRADRYLYLSKRSGRNRVSTRLTPST
ncbi:MAG: diguanylate cyclase, partial [Acidobacteriota bacterium]